MEKYKVLSVDNLTTASGKPYKKVSLEKDGTVIDKVSAFAWKFPALDKLVVDAEVEGQIVVDGNYKNLVGVVEKPKGNPAFKQKLMEETMEKKANYITNAQNNKEQGIKVASTIRMAVDITIALPPEMREETIQETIRFWRKWIWGEWDNHATL